MIHRMNLKTMGLSNEQIQKIVKSRPNQKCIQRGISHQSRLRFHSDTTLDERDQSEAYRVFTQWIGVQQPPILPKDKFDRFLQLLRFPLSTVEITESIYSRLRKVFDSQDAFYNYEFTTPELKSDWDEYRDCEFWVTKGFQAMQTAIDSVWVVDLPELQVTSRPEPFNRLIDISQVIDIQNDEFLNCEYVIFQFGDYVLAYDSEYIRVYESKGEVSDYSGVEIAKEPEKEILHGLGYTPARQFWSEQLNARNYINREAPITKELADLDWLLFHMTSKKYMTLSNSYPITIAFDFDGDFEDSDITDDKGKAVKRPKGNMIMGPGSIYVAPTPIDSTDANIMSDPVKFISPDVNTLKWHVDEENRLTNKIYRSVVGADPELRNEMAKNENQVDAAFEAQLSVLFRVKRNFEIINKFADHTIAKLRYGDSFINCSIDYGTRFFLKDVNELHQDFKLAKESGASDTILSQIQDNILDTKHKEDRYSRKRAEIIRDLDPLPEKTIEETIKILDKGGIDKINFIIKSNLVNFVRRFERDNINLVDFGRDINYAQKIKTIQNEFKDYAREQNDAGEQSAGDSDQSD